MTTPAWQVPGGDEQALEFDLDATPAWEIRDAVRALLAPDTSVVVEDAILIIDEMVANAREHGSPPWRCRLGLHTTPARLRVEVDDSNPADPHLRTPDTTGGRGMILLDRIATSWGIAHYGRFKTVWAELPLDYPRLPPMGAAPKHPGS
ncbi:ATP-binding protein [Nocardia sp. NPDC050712]|uniref:ATP-binding protein n=1 Tax=Nocardia sp. NPDC050712 TaxID=3155518 RepID=UPI0033D30A65